MRGGGGGGWNMGVGARPGELDSKYPSPRQTRYLASCVEIQRTILACPRTINSRGVEYFFDRYKIT